MDNIADGFRNALVNSLKRHAVTTSEIGRFVTELDHIDCSKPELKSSSSPPDAAKTYLPTAVEGLACDEPLARATQALAGVLHWYQIFEGEGIEPELAQGMVAGQLAGQIGLVDSARVRSGLFLLAPGIHYPLHQHGASEFYYVLSGQLTLQHTTHGAPFVLEPGRVSVTPDNRVHALTTGRQPCLLAYAWIGDVEAPNWWWEADRDGGWVRHCWVRRPDASWLRTRSEPVTRKVLVEAGELGS